QPGEFVTVPGFEWTSANHGHRNVYFREVGAEPFQSVRPGSPRNTIEDGAPTPLDLWAYLDHQGIPAITVPHHMSVAWFPLSLDDPPAQSPATCRSPASPYRSTSATARITTGWPRSTRRGEIPSTTVSR